MNRDTVTPGQIVMYPNGRGSFLLVAVVILPTLLMLFAFPASLPVVGIVFLGLVATTLRGLIRVGAVNKRIVLRHFAKTADVDAFVADTRIILGETEQRTTLTAL